MAQDKILHLEVEQRRKSLRTRKKAKGGEKRRSSGAIEAKSQKKKEFQGEVDIYVRCYQGFKLDKDRDLPIGFDKMEMMYNLNKSHINT